MKHISYLIACLFLSLHSALYCMEPDLQRIIDLPDGQVITITIEDGKLKSYLNRKHLHTYFGNYKNYITLIWDKNDEAALETVIAIINYIEKNRIKSKEYIFFQKENYNRKKTY